VKALAYLTDGKPTTSCNVGTGKGTTVLEVLQATERISGRQVPYVMSPRRAGDPVEVYADPTFAAQTLGWRAQYSLDDIIATAWQWHSTHIEGYAK
jgi:UDP-glucose 4-epimerase